jgi:hypothetical protein
MTDSGSAMDLGGSRTSLETHTPDGVSNLLQKHGGRTFDWVELRSNAVRAPRDANQPSVKSRSFSPPQLSRRV